MFHRGPASLRDTEDVTMRTTRTDGPEKPLSKRQRQDRRDRAAAMAREQEEIRGIWTSPPKTRLPYVRQSLEGLPTFRVECDHDLRIPVYACCRSLIDGDDYWRLAKVLSIGRTARIQFADNLAIRAGVDPDTLRAVAAQIGGEE